MKYKQMEYKRDRCSEVLADDRYMNHRFVIKSLGTHPVAYVQIPSKPINTREICCHGGVTYSEGDLNIDGFEVKGFWIGWDYAHWGDRYGFLVNDAKTWSTEEIAYECKKVIEQLIKMGF